MLEISVTCNHNIFLDIFPGLSRTLNFNFQDFSGPGILNKKSRTFQEA